MAKGTKLNELVTVTSIGSSCMGCMSWETPYARFQTSLGEATWQSDLAHGLEVGDVVQLTAFAYDKPVAFDWGLLHDIRLRKVRIENRI